MVAPLYLGTDSAVRNFGEQSFWYHEIIQTPRKWEDWYKSETHWACSTVVLIKSRSMEVTNTPSYVAGSRVPEVCPKWIDCFLVWIQMAEAVHKPFLQKVREIVSFFSCEASCSFIALGVGQVLNKIWNKTCKWTKQSTGFSLEW